ncbi:MAG TPA: TIGR03943 family protein [Clostridia bacterium]|nr:TIGR03943 family protein [Clostridia bacterium]
MERLRHLNATIALKIFLLLGFAVFFVVTIVTGTVRLYVHPRIIPFILFAAVAMVIIALLLSRKLFSPIRASLDVWLLFFAVPLLMAFTIPAKPFDASTDTTGTVQLISNSAAMSAAQADASTSSSVSESPSGTADISQTLPQVEIQKPDLSLQDGVLALTSENFYAGLCEVYDHLDNYKGVPISLVGFVLKDSSFTENEFVPARLMMVCCAADMQPAGLLCLYDGTAQLKVDSWVKVDGIIGETSFEGETIPCILAQSVTPAAEPTDPYVYPY